MQPARDRRLFHAASGDVDGARDLAQFRGRIKRLRASTPAPKLAGSFVAYTDGSCRENPGGPGGWGLVVSLHAPDAERTWELWGHLSSTTHNRAEAFALLGAICWVPDGSELDVYADAAYLGHMLNGRKRGGSNPDIWTEVRRLITRKRLCVRVHWVRGHSGDHFNERADQLSVLGTCRGKANAWGAKRLARSTIPVPLVGLKPNGRKEAGLLRLIARRMNLERPLTMKHMAFVRRLQRRAEVAARRAA